MRRVVAAAVGTVAGLIMLLSFKTHAVPTTLASPPALVSGTSPNASAASGPPTPHRPPPAARARAPPRAL